MYANSERNAATEETRTAGGASEEEDDDEALLDPFGKSCQSVGQFPKKKKAYLFCCVFGLSGCDLVLGIVLVLILGR